MSLKEKISSPLEAGQSLLDAHHLPPHLGPALEYASGRLARRSVHLTLAVVRRDYQVPSVVTPHGSPGLSMPPTPGSPPPATPTSKFSFASSPVTALKQLVRSASCHDSATARIAEAQRSAASTPAHTLLPLESPGLRLRWPLTPSTPLSPPPMTPCTASSTTTDATGTIPQSSFGLRLVHDSDLSSKAERTLRRTLLKAEQKYGVGSSWLAPAISPAACGLTSHLIHTSVVQNEVLFSSDGLTLVSLDRLYSLKSALSSYSKTKSPMRLEDAVDELRRFVLANNGIKVTKADLLRSYDGLSVSKSAMSDLDSMYRRAYGGPDYIGAISGMPKMTPPASQEPMIRPDDDNDDDDFIRESSQEDIIGIALTTIDDVKPPSPKSSSPKPPVLKLQTTFEPKTARRPTEYDDDNNDDEDELTARPLDRPHASMQMWHNSSIDQVLSAGVLSPVRSSIARSSVQHGPMTPNGYEDISPITRGEWGFLMVDDAFQGGRTVAIETF